MNTAPLLVVVTSIKEPVVLFLDAFRKLMGSVTKDKKSFL